VEDARVTGSRILPRLKIGAFAAACALALAACGPKTPPEPAAASDVAPAASDAASDASASGQAAAADAISSAAVPAAGTVANDKGDNQKVPKPSVNISQEAAAGGDEAPQDLRNRVEAAKAAGNAPVQPKP
jgi:hypothetical protein